VNSATKEKVAFVTGGTSPIGAAIVRRLSSDGCSVRFTFCSNEEGAQKLARECDASAFQIDFTGVWEPPDMAVDILVNNAGVNLAGKEIVDTPDEEIERSMAINFLAPVRLMREYCKGMRTRGFGRIVNINSGMGLTAPAKRLSYTASKHALRAATRSLAQELAPYQITVNDVCPGPVDSAMFRVKANEAVSSGRFATVEDYLADFVTQVPMGRFITADEVASAVAFLASPLSGACTGLAVRVDGGKLNV
jgi:NAD(P)-dependent dehydrogenase (short-subunit alcohol dehydrogenase family)